MEFTTSNNGSNACIKAQMQPGEKFQAIAGALVVRTGDTRVVGSVWGGWWKSLTRSWLGGESFFFQQVSAGEKPGHAIIAPSSPGDIAIIPVRNHESFYVQNGCLLAAFGEIHMFTAPQRIARAFFSGAGFFVLKVYGEGDFAVSAFGALMPIEVPAGEKYVVDNGHIVAWSGDMDYQVVRGASSWVSTITSGEGLACEFKGPGRVWIQTRSPKSFGSWIRRMVPAPSST